MEDLFFKRLVILAPLLTGAPQFCVLVRFYDLGDGNSPALPELPQSYTEDLVRKSHPH